MKKIAKAIAAAIVGAASAHANQAGLEVPPEVGVYVADAITALVLALVVYFVPNAKVDGGGGDARFSAPALAALAALVLALGLAGCGAPGAGGPISTISGKLDELAEFTAADARAAEKMALAAPIHDARGNRVGDVVGARCWRAVAEIAEARGERPDAGKDAGAAVAWQRARLARMRLDSGIRQRLVGDCAGIAFEALGTARRLGGLALPIF
ncbi:MAG: hypothetical protein QF893_24635 [Alphaproteobacteria bacterium]|jgi:hypothetical protein|nr:hypothetical protein [Alphaproteobacteria bacterium]